MSRTVTYYLSLISPFTYLGQPRVMALGSRADVDIIYKPFDIAKVFGETGTLPLGKRHPSLQAYRLLELERLGRNYSLPININPKHFPSPSTQAGATVVILQEQGVDVGALVMGLLKGVWADERNLVDTNDLMTIANEAGLDGEALVTEAATESAQSVIAQNSEEALAAGVFGSPSLVIDGEIFWGQDRIDLAAKHLN